jgi:uncharacterized protein (DUF1800 family)
LKNASWVLGLPILAVALTACGGGSSSNTATGTPPSGTSGTPSSGGSTPGSGTGTTTNPPPVSIPGSTTNLTAPIGKAAAARLLMQGTFGATQDTISSTAAQSYNAWFTAQAAITPSTTLQGVTAQNTDWSPTWFNNVTLGQDQLRQRMAFALSELLVVSNTGASLNGHNYGLAYYYDLLSKDALGNYRQLLEDVTLSPAMGEFLSMMRNNKPNPATGVHADQNYAREIMQLFSIGLVKLNIDGSVVTDSTGNGVPTYTIDDIIGLSNVLTGWGSASSGHTGEQAWMYDLNETTQMVAYEDHHDTDAKAILGGVQVPAGQTAAADLKIALDTIFNHPNVGPFVSKQLIQRLVTSNPSPAYVQRVAQVFNNDGNGVRGNLLAVAEAILTDQEAVTAGTANTAGKLREPLLRTTNLWRAFNSYSGNNRVNDPTLMIYAYQWFNQYPLQAPSVFNFFQPSYQLAGALTQAGMVAPEFQITNEASLVNTDNALQAQAYQYVDSAGNQYAGPDYSMLNLLSAANPFLHTAQWEALAADPGSLVDEMNLVLMAGQMSTDMRNVLVNYATSIPATSAATRVAETAELLITSPEYAIQR